MWQNLPFFLWIGQFHLGGKFLILVKIMNIAVFLISKVLLISAMLNVLLEQF